MKAKVFIMEDNEVYFEIIKEVLENMSLTFYPDSKNDFEELRDLLCTLFSCNDSMKKESTEKFLEILKDKVDEETTFLISCCLGEFYELEGLDIYKMFIKGYGGKTIITSSTTLSEEIRTIKNFCEKEPNCFLFRKSKISLRENLGKYL